MPLISVKNSKDIFIEDTTVVSAEPVDFIEADGVQSLVVSGTVAISAQQQVRIHKEFDSLEPAERLVIRTNLDLPDDEAAAGVQRNAPRLWAIAKEILGVTAQMASVVNLIRALVAH